MNWFRFKALRYILSGLTATTLNLLAVYVFTDWLLIYYLLSSMIGFTLGLIVSFFLQKFWTFSDQSRLTIHWQAAMFFATAVAGVGLNSFLVYCFVEFVSLHYLTAQILAGVIIAGINFLIYQKLIFSKLVI